MPEAEIIGLMAAVLTTSAFVPQVYKVWSEKSAKDISLTMYLVLFVGLVLWLVFGILMNSISIILANSVTLVLVTAILIVKLKYK